MKNEETNKISLAKKLIKQILPRVIGQEKLDIENKEQIRESVRNEISKLMLLDSNRISEKIKEELQDILKIFDSMYEQVFDEFCETYNKTQEENKQKSEKQDSSIQKKADEFNTLIRSYMKSINTEQLRKEQKIELQYKTIMDGKFVKQCEDKEIGE